MQFWKKVVKITQSIKFKNILNYFFRCNDEGTNLHPSMIKIDFEEHWKKFITTEYRKLRDGEGSRLMRRYGISDRDIKDFHLRRRRKEKQNTSGSGFEDPEQVTVTNTCQRLFAIEQLLEELGTKPAVFMAKSKSLEKRWVFSRKKRCLFKKHYFSTDNMFLF